MKLRQPSIHHTAATTHEERLKLTIMVLKLLEHWQLDTRTQLTLLGMKSSSRAILSKYRNGERAIPDDVDKLDRIALLLLIHKCLRLLYPENPELVYQWINLNNRKLNDERPLDLILKNGIIGLAKVARYLEFQLVR
jgi:hypothetical protein